MSFKFRLGDVVVPSGETSSRDLPSKPAEVIAIQLRGFIRIKFLNENGGLLVESKDYELWNQEKNQRTNL